MSKMLGSWNVSESGVNLEMSRQYGGHGIVALSGEQGLKFTCSVPLDFAHLRWIRTTPWRQLH